MIDCLPLACGPTDRVQLFDLIDEEGADGPLVGSVPDSQAAPDIPRQHLDLVERGEVEHEGVGDPGRAVVVQS
jgi:hypothetical protein